MSKLILKVGHVYRGKRIRNCKGLVNDRIIIWMNAEEIQFDSPSVADGRHYPTVSIGKFIAWADRDVTKELPEDLWADYPPEKPVAAKNQYDSNYRLGPFEGREL